MELQHQASAQPQANRLNSSNLPDGMKKTGSHNNKKNELSASKTNQFLKKENESTPSRVLQKVKVKDIFGNQNDDSSEIDLDSVKGNN